MEGVLEFNDDGVEEHLRKMMEESYKGLEKDFPELAAMMADERNKSFR